ncbi:DEKNAAC104508 [Brettanomyces naardenensis]|uniref:DEKNAAC104508 n=1 Tax=Brettanomyces naardenensis TaxID=13370 RepID=A0A448YRC7_BRENA|nr:DEKNAAC104508 [Brettanomyces naardenensis]
MSTISLATYIFWRIKQIGVDTIFGVPGDFNLSFLDHIDEVDGLRWAGNANELNAAYSADGYSRIKGFAAICTTFGVGELSATNGVAGAYAEHVGLIHIVGGPTVNAEEHKLLLHHTLANGKFNIFKDMSKNITVKAVSIEDIATAPAVVDDLIRTGYVYKRPVYLVVPSNFSEAQVPASLLRRPIDLSLPPNEPLAEKEFIEHVIKKIVRAKNPCILVDACAARHDVKNSVEALVKATQFPVYVTPMGKSAFNEDSPRFSGVYVGALSKPDVKESLENSDLILSIGGLLSDYNTGAFTYHYHTTNVVEFHSDFCKVRSAVYMGIQMQTALSKIIRGLAEVDLKYTPTPIPASVSEYKSVQQITSGKLTQQYLWYKLSYFLRAGDIVVAETGTSSFGILQAHYPAGVTAISQVLWGSIGYALPSSIGAAFAAEEIDRSKRVILFIGDGSLQLTVQAISDAFRQHLHPYLFVLNNKGYTIEKMIHGLHAEYNNIQPWDHKKILELFHYKDDYEYLKVGTVEEMNKLYKDPEFNKPTKLRLIELMLDEFDAPKNLIEQARLSEIINSGKE